MSRQKAKPPEAWQTPTGNAHEHHVVLYDSLILSDTWAHLHPQACKLYLLMLAQFKGMYTGNSIKCPYKYCVAHGFRYQSLPQYFEELETAGLIEKVSQGGLYKQANIYRFSDKWHNKRSP